MPNGNVADVKYVVLLKVQVYLYSSVSLHNQYFESFLISLTITPKFQTPILTFTPLATTAKYYYYISKGYSSYKSQPNVFKHVLNFSRYGLQKSMLGIYQIGIFEFPIFNEMFSKISYSPLYPMEKSKTTFIWKTSDRRARGNEIYKPALELSSKWSSQNYVWIWKIKFQRCFLFLFFFLFLFSLTWDPMGERKFQHAIVIPTNHCRNYSWISFPVVLAKLRWGL